jgi:hypothetical protein
LAFLTQTFKLTSATLLDSRTLRATRSGDLPLERARTAPIKSPLYSVDAYLDDNYIHLHGRRTINEVNLLWRASGLTGSMPMAPPPGG